MLRRTPSKKIFEAPNFALCPAKTFNCAGQTMPGRSTPEHCTIVGEMARAIVGRYPPALGSKLFPLDAPFAAACHDIGKVSPTFYNKLRKACQLERLPGFSPELEKQWGGHAGVSQAAAKGMLAPKYLPEILGQHHGFSPQLAGKRAEAEQFGGEAWQAQRVALVEELKTRLHMDWPQIASPEQARLVAGLTSVADWIGSGQHFEDPNEPWQGKIEQALDEAGFIPPSYRQGLSFEQVFPFPPQSSAKPVDRGSLPARRVCARSAHGAGQDRSGAICRVPGAGTGEGLRHLLCTAHPTHLEQDPSALR